MSQGQDWNGQQPGYGQQAWGQQPPAGQQAWGQSQGYADTQITPPPAAAQPQYGQQQQPPQYGQQQAYGQPQQQPQYGQAYQQPGQAYPQAAMVPAAAYGMAAPAPVQVPPGMYLDQVSGLVIPEGTQVASVGRRIGSFFLAPVLAFVTLGIGYLIWGAISWAKGQTPTQSVLGMQTWRVQTATAPTWGEQFVREISRIVYAVPFVGWIAALVSFFMFVSGNEHRALHDNMGGTIVLYDPNRVVQQQLEAQGQAQPGFQAPAPYYQQQQQQPPQSW